MKLLINVNKLYIICFEFDSESYAHWDLLIEQIIHKILVGRMNANVRDVGPGLGWAGGGCEGVGEVGGGDGGCGLVWVGVSAGAMCHES